MKKKRIENETDSWNSCRSHCKYENVAYPKKMHRKQKDIPDCRGGKTFPPKRDQRGT